MKSKPPIISWILLALTTAIFVYIRIRLLSLPLERDEGEYAYAGQRILHGGIPYRDIYNMKFPGVYYFYSLFLVLFGNTVSAIRLGTLFINLFTAFFLLKAGEKLKNLTAGIFTAASFIILSSAPWFHGLMSNTEHFVNLFISISAYLMFLWVNDRKNILLFLIGITAGFACLMKQHGAYFIIVPLITVLIYTIPQKRFFKIIQPVFILLSGFIISILLLLSLVFMTGTFNEFVFLTIKYGLSYISHTSLSQGITLFFISFNYNIENDRPIWLLTLISIILSYKLVSPKLFCLLLIWLILSVAAIFPGYYFRQHYFLLIVPVASVYCGVLLDYFLSIKNSTYKYLPQVLSSLLFIVSLSYILVSERRIFFTDTPTMASEGLYGVQFTEAATVADSVRNYLRTNSHMLVIGSEPEIYFYTNSIAATSYVYMYPMMEDQPWRDSMLTEFIHQSVHNKPEVVVIMRQVPAEGVYQQGVIFALMASKPGYILKGFCYEDKNNNDNFVWNSNDSTKSPDSIIWKVYARKK